MRKMVILAGLVFWAVSISGQSKENPAHMMSKAEFGAFLQTLETDQSRWRATVAKVDVSSFNVSYGEGKNIENARGVCLTDLDSLLRDRLLHALSGKVNLTLQVALLDELSELSGHIGTLEDFLSNLVSTENARDISRAQQSARDLLDVERQVSRDHEKLYGHVLALTKVIDSRIDTEKLLQ
jgi:hypothetical protein